MRVSLADNPKVSDPAYICLRGWLGNPWDCLWETQGAAEFCVSGRRKRCKLRDMEHHFADCPLDDGHLTLMRRGSAVAVEPKVFDLIHLLARNAGGLVTRDRMAEEVWGGRIVSESAVSACIAGARKAVGDDGKTQAVIRTVPRRGLILVAEVSR